MPTIESPAKRTAQLQRITNLASKGVRPTSIPRFLTKVRMSGATSTTRQGLSPSKSIMWDLNGFEFTSSSLCYVSQGKFSGSGHGHGA